MSHNVENPAAPTDTERVMYRTVYVSSATLPFDRDALRALLEVSRRNNESVGVTGMLLHHDGSFIQTLEGEYEAVRGVMQRIGRDERHTGILRLIEEHCDERAFGDWSMGYVSRDRLSDAEIEGYSSFLHEVASTGVAPSRAHKLLESFKRCIR